MTIAFWNSCDEFLSSDLQPGAVGDETSRGWTGRDIMRADVLAHDRTRQFHDSVFTSVKKNELQCALLDSSWLAD